MAAGMESGETREEASRPELPQGYNLPLKTVQRLELEQLDRELAIDMVRTRFVSEHYNFFFYQNKNVTYEEIKQNN